MMRRHPRTIAAAATCSLLLSSYTLPARANHADLFFDFSSKIRAGTTSSGGDVAATDESSQITPSDVASAFSELVAEVEESPVLPKELAQAVAELEELFAELMPYLEAELESKDGGQEDDASFATVETDAALNMTTESLLSLSAQVPANASAAEWIYAYGDLLSKEQQGYYNAEGSGYTT